MSHDHEYRERPIRERFCIEPTCQFYDKHAQQGICHTDKGDLVDWERVDEHEKRAEEDLVAIRAKYAGDKDEYIRWLEAHFECAQLNWALIMDECVRLRRDNALLRAGSK